MTLYFSRLSLSRDPAVSALGALLDPDAMGPRQDANHRLIWSCFATSPDRRRDFLWRAEGRGQFLLLSRTPPANSPFFEPPETKEFVPDLQPGDRLAFALRANATRTEKTGTLSANGREKKRHIDLVMDALKDVPRGERAPHRMDAAQKVAQHWLARQGERAGFTLCQAGVGDYSVLALPGRQRGKNPPQFGILDLTGVLQITEPERFLAALASGFGRAKSFGCGLMLIRRT